MKKFEVWLEGYKPEWMIELGDIKAFLMGKVEAPTFIEACKIACTTSKWISDDLDGYWENYFKIDEEGNPWFGKARLWDNEADARKRNG